MALESFCAACTYLGENADYEGKYWCSEKGENHYACDPKCYSFCEAYSRSNSARENMYDNSASHKSSGGCYLTTIMCKILGYDDNNYYLNTLRKFRDTKMKMNIKYLPLLVTYDTIGPLIAKALSEDTDKEVIAKTLFNRYIIPSVSAIEEEKEQLAIDTYIAMTNVLAEKYNINTNIIMPNIDEIDYNLLGHGRSKQRTLKKETI